MDDRNTYLYVLLLLNIMAVSSYLQFVVPGVTQADSSSAHVSQFPSGPYPYWPNRTVDGNFSQNIKTCLHTAYSNVTEAWLRIDLQTVRSIKIVKFWYRNDRGSAAQSTIRLRGYSIRVSNTSDVSPGSTDACFTDDKSYILPTVIQEECTARYVWFYQPNVRDSRNNAPILEICEVQIFGCEIGTYDVNCSKKHVAIVKIVKRVKLILENVTKMDVHFQDLNRLCVVIVFLDCTVVSVTLTVVSSVTISYVMEDGYIGGLCKTPCPNGYFGRKCLETCGKCLADQICNNINGTCMDGCNKGFKGNLCKKGELRSTQDPETPFVAGIAVLVAVNVSMTAVIAVLVVMLRNACKRNETNSHVNDFDMYNSPNGKPENNVYDVIVSS